MTTPKFNEIFCIKFRGGKSPLWHAFKRESTVGLTGDALREALKRDAIRGAGNTADNAIKDYQQQWRRRIK